MKMVGTVIMERGVLLLGTPEYMYNQGLTRAYESLKNVLANLAVVFQNLQAQQNFHRPWPVGRGLS